MTQTELPLRFHWQLRLIQRDGYATQRHIGTEKFIGSADEAMQRVTAILRASTADAIGLDLAEGPCPMNTGTFWAESILS